MEAVPKSDFNDTEDSDGKGLVHSLTRRSNLFLFSYSPQLKALISWTDNASDILGVKDSAISRDGNLFLRHVHPDDRFILMSDLEKTLLGRQDYRASYRWIRPDTNETRWLHCRAVVTGEKESTLVEGIIIDLTDEFTGSTVQLAGPDSTAAILAAIPRMVITLDSELRLLRINRHSLNQSFNFGDPNFLETEFTVGKPLLSCFKDENKREQLERVLISLLDRKEEHAQQRIEINSKVFRLEMDPLIEQEAVKGLLLLVTDISDIVKMETQLAQLQKNEGLRLLAAGVAHHFNNSLQSIIGQAAIISSQADKPELVKKAAESIQEIVSRTSELSRQLFVFDDSSKDVMVPVDLNLSTMAAVNKVEGLFSSGVKVAVNFGTIQQVLANQEELVEAITEILKNSKESVKEGGNISIVSYEKHLKENKVPDLPEGNYVCLAITDTGEGMDEATIQKCFDPFFTTKGIDPKTGVGISDPGLGLSQALTTLRRFGGGIKIKSKKDEGTSVYIYVPLTDTGVPAIDEQTSKQIGTTNAPEVLIVDDDRLVLQTIEAVIRDMGFRAATSDGFRSALSIVKEHAKTLKLVLLDAVMPGMNGAAVLRRIKKIEPDLKVIGFSGAPDEYTQPLLEAGAVTLLRKPVTPSVLREEIIKVLGEVPDKKKNCYSSLNSEKLYNPKSHNSKLLISHEIFTEYLSSKVIKAGSECDKIPISVCTK